MSGSDDEDFFLDSDEMSDGSGESDIEESEDDVNTPNEGLGTAFGDALSRILTTAEHSAPLDKNQRTIREIEDAKIEHKIRAKLKQQKKEKFERAHILPEHYSTREEEKRLVKVSTRGVVKLLNAVQAHKKTMSRELRAQKKIKSETVEKLSKEKFFELLNTSSTPKEQTHTNTEEPTTDATTSTKWSVLDDGYLLGNQRLKDWDTQMNEEQEMERELEGEIEPLDYEDPYDDW